MCTKACLRFGWKNIKTNEVKDKRVIEVGSFNVNGSLRSHILKMSPREYIGVDIKSGPYVDVVCNAYDILEKFGANTFNMVLSTEMMEHVEDWRKVISNFKNICMTNGIMLITTRSKGFGRHDYPGDYWRYEIEDMKEIFSDCAIEVLEKDWRHPGVFIKAIKPTNFIEKDLSGYNLYKIP